MQMKRTEVAPAASKPNSQFATKGAASNGEHNLNPVQRAVLFLSERVCRQQVPHLIPHLDRLGHHVHLVTVHPRIVFILQGQVAVVVGVHEHFDHGVKVELPRHPSAPAAYRR